MPPKRAPAIDRVLAKVSYDSGCWRYDGYRLSGGYGIIGSVDGAGSSGQLTHRLVYEALVGPIPPGMHIDHLCRNRACCNPMHLEPVTHAENVRRGQGNAGRSQFTSSQVDEMARLRADGLTQAQVAKRFGVSRAMVSLLTRGRLGWSATGVPNKSGGTRPMSERTHCPHGHPYDEANTIRQGNRRLCRACRNAQSMRYYQQRKAGA